MQAQTTNNRKQNGFSVIEILLALLVFVAICLTGAYIWYLHSKTKALPASSNLQPVVQQISNFPVVPSGWKLYKVPTYGIKFAYPSNWSVGATSFKTGGNSDGMIYEVGATPPPVKGADGHGDPIGLEVLDTSLKSAVADAKGLDQPPQAVKSAWDGTLTNIDKGGYQGVKLTTVVSQTNPSSTTVTSLYLFSVKGLVFRTSYIEEKDTLNPATALLEQQFLNSISITN